MYFAINVFKYVFARKDVTSFKPADELSQDKTAILVSQQLRHNDTDTDLR